MTEPQETAGTDASPEQKVLEIISQVCRVPLDKLQPETRLVQDLGVDSVMTLDLLLELEDAFDRDIPEADAAALMTVGQIQTYAREHAAD